MRPRLLALLTIVVALGAGTPLGAPEALATDYFVSPDGTGDFPSIQAALDAASWGDAVNALPGRHHEQVLRLRPGVVLRGSTGLRDEVKIVVVRDIHIEGGVIGNLELDLGFGQMRFEPEANLRLQNMVIDGTGLGLFLGDSVSVRSNDSVYRYEGPGGTGTFDFTRCTFQSTHGFVLLGSNRVQDCTFKSVVAPLDGSAASRLELFDSTFEDCNRDGISPFAGGAVVLAPDGDVENCTFLRCRAGLGGALFGANVEGVRIWNCVFEDNVAGNRGGAVYLGNGSNVEIRSRFRGNQAGVDGGAVRLFRMSNTEMITWDFEENHAGEKGGAIAVLEGSATLTVDNFAPYARNYDRNTAGETGGALYVELADVSVSRQWFADCEAPSGSHVAIGAGGEIVADRLAFSRSDSSATGSLVEIALGARLVLDSAHFVADPTTAATPINTSFGSASLKSCYFEGFPSFLATGQPSTLSFECSGFFPAGPTGGPLWRLIEEQPDLSSFELGRCDFRNVASNSVATGRFGCPSTSYGLCDPYGVYVATKPVGLRVEVDGEETTGGDYVPADVGGILSLAAADYSDEDGRYTFLAWSDGGAAVHDAAVQDYLDVFTAEFLVEFVFSTTASGEGVVTPEYGYFQLGSEVVAAATPEPGWAFDHWEDQNGAFIGDANPDTVTIVGSDRRVAVFLPGVDVRIDSEPSGLQATVDDVVRDLPYESQWVTGSEHVLRAPSLQEQGPGARARFVGWESGEPQNHLIIVGTDSVREIAQYQEERELDVNAGPGGGVADVAGWYDRGEVVEITALPDFGYEFAGWIGTGDGAYTGPDNPATISMNGPVSQEAQFRNIIEADGYEFTLSASDSDPYLHTSAANDSLRRIYLWVICAGRGLAALEAGLESDLVVLGFEPTPGVINIGSPTELLLAVGGCPLGPQVTYLLGSFLVLDTGGSICLGPSAANGLFAAVDCDQLNPSLTPDPGVTGFSSVGTPCRHGLNDCGENPIPVRLSNLRAEPGERVVHVRWQTTAEVDHVGFRVYRSSAPTGPWEERTADLYAGQSPYDFVDDGVLPDRRYFYSVGAVDTGGREVRYGPVEVVTPAWRPVETALAPVRPNPFTQQADIAFSLATPGLVKISIFDVRGRLVRGLADEEYRTGEHVVPWDGRDSAGRIVPAGVYFSRLVADGYQESRKLTKIGVR